MPTLRFLLAAVAMLPLSAAATASPKPLARFEHVYSVLDADTAQAIKTSAYLRDFCGLQEKTTLADEGHYHGTYIMGRESYVELFGPADLNLDGPAAAVGLVGIGLNTEKIGNLERMKVAVEKNGLPVELRTFHKMFGTKTVEWFKGLGMPEALDGSAEKSTTPVVEIFTAEFLPSYFEVPEADKAPALGPDDVISRARYHRRDYGAGHLLQNISGVTLAVTREDWPMLRATLAGAGFRVTESSSGARAVGDVVVDALFVPRQQVGLREVDFILSSKSPASHVEVLGRSRLVVGPGARATWSFEPTIGR